VKAGVSLLELMVCFTLATLLVIFVLNLFPGSLLALRQAEIRLEAGHQAEVLLDRARVAPFATYSVGTSTPISLPGWNQTPFQATLQSLPVAGCDTSSVKELRVTVAWDGRRAERSLRICLEP